MSIRLDPVHPGEVLETEFLAAMDITQYRLSKGIGVDPRRINEIVQGKRAVTADTALRLAKFFGTSPELWMGLQADYELEVAARTKDMSKVEVYA